LELIAENLPDELPTIKERVTSAAATIRNVLEGAEERGTIH
jgi:hypothetical protein